MKKLLIILGIIAFIVILMIGSFVGTYNSLQMLDEGINSYQAQVENQLQRRGDLIPNLVNTVKGYASHEREIFTEIAESRAKLSGAVHSGSVDQINRANSEFTGALSRLMAIAENYPDLKANQNFIALQDELSGTENRIAVARMDYNESVRRLNAKVRTFPTSIIAGMSGIMTREYFQTEEARREIPQVNF